MKAKKLLTAALAGLMAFGAFAIDMPSSSAATRAELAAINVSKKGNFKYWEKNSPAKQQLINYVKDVTDPKSANFIPVEDRIAVFDADGTLICETAPYYFDWMMYLNSVIDNPKFQMPSDIRNQARRVRAAFQSRDANAESLIDSRLRSARAAAFDGMTLEEYKAFVADYMNTTYAEGLTNLKIGEAFYLPMVEVVSYLNANKFTCYIVSGCDREILRVLVDGVMDIKTNHIIGSDYSYRTKKLAGEPLDKFLFEPDDQILRGNKRLIRNLGTNKVLSIRREIGKQAVLAFGNSMGDASMFNDTVANNKYRSAAFVLMCDDLEREFGNVSAAEKIKAAAARYGWQTVSMRDDWATIYGDNVRKEQ